MNNDKVIDMALTEIPEFLVQRGFAWVCLPTVKVFRDQDTGQLYVEEYTDEAELAEIEDMYTCVQKITNAYVISGSFGGGFYRLGAGHTCTEAIDMALHNAKLW